MMLAVLISTFLSLFPIGRLVSLTDFIHVQEFTLLLTFTMSMTFSLAFLSPQQILNWPLFFWIFLPISTFSFMSSLIKTIFLGMGANERADQDAASGFIRITGSYAAQYTLCNCHHALREQLNTIQYCPVSICIVLRSSCCYTCCLLPVVRKVLYVMNYDSQTQQMRLNQSTRNVSSERHTLASPGSCVENLHERVFDLSWE